LQRKSFQQRPKNRCILDIEIVKKNIREYKNKAREERKVLDESTKLLKKLIYPQIKIKIGKNSRFTTKDLLDILVHVAQTHDFANNGCKTFKDLYEDKDVPNGDTFLYHFKKIDSRTELASIFGSITDVIFNFAKKNYNLLNRRKLDIAYDIHKIPLYGNKNSDYVKGGKHERGTSYFYHFLTCDIVVAGKRFTVDVIPIHPLQNINDLLDVSLRKVKKKIHVDRVFLDRGFANSNCVGVLKKNKVSFIMPMSKNEKVKQWMDKSEECNARLIENFGISNQLVNMYLVDDEDGIKRSFITNLNVPVESAHRLYDWYGRIWGIETGYRLKAQDFRPRTTSRNYTVRLFYFFFTVMLYNLWVLTNIIVGVKLYGKVPKTPLISAKRFSIILYKIQLEFSDPGG
jgi:putative transposase